MGEFPSGQRGQTVNLLRIASMVRIRPPPPQKDQSERIGLFVVTGIWRTDSKGGFQHVFGGCSVFSYAGSLFPCFWVIFVYKKWLRKAVNCTILSVYRVVI